jgi:hypothetical protein
MIENNSSNISNSPVREQDVSKKFDTTKKSYLEGSIISKNVSKE